MTNEDFIKWAKDRGYRAYLGSTGLKECSAYAYKRSISTKKCELNNREPEIVIYFYAADNRLPYAGVEADIYGQFAGVHRRTTLYGLTLENFITRIEEIEATLVRMWEA